VFTQPNQASIGLFLAQLGHVFASPRPISPSPDDPVFLPDFVTLTPDQAQELRYGKGRDQ
jgi:hypothetical protein